MSDFVNGWKWTNLANGKTMMTGSGDFDVADITTPLGARVGDPLECEYGNRITRYKVALELREVSTRKVKKVK